MHPVSGVDMDEETPDTLKIEWAGEMTRVDLKPGDTLVFMFQERLSNEALVRIQANAERLFPGQKILVLEYGTTVGVLSKGE